MQDMPPNPDAAGENATPPEYERGMSVAAANEPLPETNFAADLEKQLHDALGDAAKLNDALLRAAADSDNMRKRAQADLANAHKFALDSFSSELLSVKDSLEAAMAVENARWRATATGSS